MVKKFALLVTLLLLFSIESLLLAQSTPFPEQEPPWGEVGDWGHVKGSSWEMNYLPFVYNSLPFRLMPPNGVTYTKGAGGDDYYGEWSFSESDKKYPLILFLHGAGEAKGNDNQAQLRHGARQHRDAVLKDKFPGYLLYPQAENGFFASWNAIFTKEVIEYLIANNQVDPNRIYVHGLSAGGAGTWEMMTQYPQLFAAGIPMSAIGPATFVPRASKVAQIPIWIGQGGLDRRPSPPATEQLLNAVRDVGGNVKYSFYPNLGHGIWNTMYADPDFFPYMLRNKKNQIHVYGGRTNFCEGQQIDVDLGVTAGFSGYEWKKDDIVIAANTNRINVQEEGSFTMRFRRGNEWTEWSDPVVIQYIGPTPPVSITASGSVHFPTLDGKTSVTLSAPDGYEFYEWSNGSTTQSIQVSNPGTYSVAVTAFNGCPGDFSEPVIVTSNSNQGPANPIDFYGTADSETQISLSWNPGDGSQNGYELYRALEESGPYEFLVALEKDDDSYTDSELTPNTSYFYQIRATNTQSASGYELVEIVTFQDVEAPSQPTKFEVIATSDNSIKLSWTSSIDNVDGLGSLVYDLTYGGNTYEINSGNSEVFPLNAALNRPITSSSNENSSRNASKANDGSLNTYWSSGRGDRESPEWIYVDLADSFLVSAATITWENDFAVDYRLQVSHDATTWEDVLTVEGNGGRYKTHKNINGIGRYLRVYIDRRRGDNRRVRLEELEVYGSNLKGYDQPTIVTEVKGLTTGDLYAFTLQARDKSGNNSASTGQITAPAVNQGLAYKYYRYRINQLSDLRFFSPTSYGTLRNFDLSPKNTRDYALVYDGYITVDEGGLYTFYTRSADGSTLSVGDFQVVDNDGRHGSQERSGQIVLAKGTYPIHAEYFNNGRDGDIFEVRWEGPGISKQLIPDEAMNTDFVFPSPPDTPANVSATATSYDEITVEWEDQSSNESSFEVFRAVSSEGPFNLVGSSTANNTTFIDSGLESKTTYFYQVRAIGPTGESAPNVGSITGNGLDYSYYEINNLSKLPDFNSYTAKTTGNLDNVTLSVRQRNDNFAFQFEGFIDIPAAGQYTFYTTSDDGSKLYIADQVVVNNDGLHGNQTRSGTRQFDAAGFYTIKIVFFERGEGESLTVEYQGPGISRQQIPNSAFKAVEYINATTLDLPPLPSAPTNVVVSGVSTSEIEIAWSDASNNETGFDIFRASGGSIDFDLIGSVEADIQSYLDIDLPAHTQYRYQVAAKGIQDQVSLSQIVEGSSLNTDPVIDPMTDVVMRINSELQVSITANDADLDEVDISAVQKPGFVSIVQDSPGLLVLSLDPTELGNYTVDLLAEDNFGGSTSLSFGITVNENYLPIITPISDITIEENTSYTANISSSDFDENDEITYSTGDLPAFANFSDNGDGTATLALNPDYTSSGIYPIEISVTDGKSTVSESFSVTVSEISVSKTFLVNFHNNSTAPVPWNNISNPTAGTTLANLIDNAGESSDLSLELMTSWTGANDFGASTGDNSGVYPDNVTRSFFYEQSTGVNTIKVGGLNPDLKYAFRFFASRDNSNHTGSRFTMYTVSNQTVELDAMGNTANSVIIKDIEPENSGVVNIDIQKQDVYTPYGYLNAVEIVSYFDNGTAPDAPEILTVSSTTSTDIAINWTDLTPDETGYKVYRSTEEAGPYDEIASLEINTSSYTDKVPGGGTYWYQITSFNNNGESEASNALSITLSNSAPIISPIGDIRVAENQITNVTISASDLEENSVSFAGENLPTFVTLTDNLDGTANLNIGPNSGDAGNYIMQIVATDDQGFSSSVDISIEISEKLIVSTYVNFNLGSNEGAPWNNFNTQPSAGTSKNNLIDESGINSGLSVTFVNKWAGSNTTGVVTGNNSGVYPDNVMKTFYWEITNEIKTVKVGGMDSNKAYNIVFFASRDGDGDRTTVYTIGNKSVSLNASRNSTKTVRINGVKGDTNGELLIQMQKTSSASFAYINSLIIESFEDTGTPTTPSELVAVGGSRSSINLSWSDNSVNETGFNIYQRSLAETNFTLLTSTNPDESTYEDTGLETNTTYVYKVSAFNDLGESTFTDDVYASSLLYTIYLNANRGYNQGQPWNNLNTVPVVGTNRTNFRDQSWVNRGVSLKVVEHPNSTTFGGANPFGMVPGGTGIYPDNVIRTFWFLEATEAARIEIGNLSETLTYNFVFFGSRDGGGNRNTDYTIDGNTVTLSAAYNISNTVQINGVQPNSNGKVFIDIISSAGSQYGYLNALVIQAYNEVPILNGARVANSGKKGLDKAGLEAELSESTLSDSHLVFPNPVTNELTVVLQEIMEEKIEIEISDGMGTQVYYKEILPETNTSISEIDFSTFATGIYFVRIIPTSEKGSVYRVIKE